MSRTKVFISYSHQDKAWLERLQVHLRPLEREDLIDRWDDTRIKAGDKWQEKIEEALACAKVAVLLVSADFLASDFIADNELPPLLAAAEADGAVIIPVILSPSLFEQTDLAQFQAVNPPHRPLIGMDREDQEQVFVKATEAIQGTFEKTARDSARQGTRREGSPMGSVSRKKQSLLHWYAGNKTWVFSGIGTAVLMALIGYLLSQGPEPSGGVHVGGDLNINGANGGTAIIQGEGTVHITNMRGISEEKFQSLSEELGVRMAALKSFFKILEQKQVPPEDLDSTLREIARRYKALDKKLATFTSDDPAVKALKDKAREALEQGDFDRTEQLLNEASDKDVRAAREIQAIARQRLLSAAASKAENGELKYTQLAYVEAAVYYREAASLVPAGEESTRADYLNSQGLAFLEAGRYAEAQQPLERALAIDEKALGPEHPSVGRDLNNLALLYHAQGRYEAAEPLYQRALAIDEKALGPEHPSVGRDLNNLALLYRAQGRYEAAEPLYQRALAIDEKALGPEHPSVGRDLNNLALLYRAQGRYEAAEPLYQRALAIDEKALGPEHPSVGRDLNNLAELYHAQGRYEDAEPLNQRALAIAEKALGPEHPSVGTHLNNLALLYHAQGRYEAAEPLYQRALAIAEKALGPEHPNVVQVKKNYALLLSEMGRGTEGGAAEAPADRRLGE